MPPAVLPKCFSVFIAILNESVSYNDDCYRYYVLVSSDHRWIDISAGDG